MNPPEIPMLSYADPSVSGSKPWRLVFASRADGFTLTDPKSAGSPRGLLLGAGIVGAFFSAAVVVNNLSETNRPHNPEVWAMIATSAVLLLSLGLLVTAVLSKPKPRVLRVTGGRVTTTGFPFSTSRFLARLHEKPSALSDHRVELLVRQPRRDVRFTTWFGMHDIVFPALAGDEAIWAVELIQSAVKSGGYDPTPHAGTPNDEIRGTDRSSLS